MWCVSVYQWVPGTQAVFDPGDKEEVDLSKNILYVLAFCSYFFSGKLIVGICSWFQINWEMQKTSVDCPKQSWVQENDRTLSLPDFKTLYEALGFSSVAVSIQRLGNSSDNILSSLWGSCINRC